MTQPDSSFLISLGIVLLALGLWYGSVLAVRRDTKRRVTRGEMRAVERELWVALSVALPLFGLALYLFARVLRGYMAAPDASTEKNEATQRIKAQVDAPMVERNLHAESAPRTQWIADLERGAGWKTRKKQPPSQAHPSTPPAPVEDTLPARAAQGSPAGDALARTDWVLMVLRGPHAGQQFGVGALPVRLGRGEDAGVALDDDLNISRAHAELYAQGGQLRIRDLGSAHGTLVNGERIEDQALQAGDWIGLGSSELMLREAWG